MVGGWGWGRQRALQPTHVAPAAPRPALRVPRPPLESPLCFCNDPAEHTLTSRPHFTGAENDAERSMPDPAGPCGPPVPHSVPWDSHHKAPGTGKTRRNPKCHTHKQCPQPLGRVAASVTHRLCRCSSLHLEADWVHIAAPELSLGWVPAPKPWRPRLADRSASGSDGRWRKAGEQAASHRKYWLHRLAGDDGPRVARRGRGLPNVQESGPKPQGSKAHPTPTRGRSRFTAGFRVVNFIPTTGLRRRVPHHSHFTDGEVEACGDVCLAQGPRAPGRWEPTGGEPRAPAGDPVPSYRTSGGSRATGQACVPAHCPLCSRAHFPCDRVRTDQGETTSWLVFKPEFHVQFSTSAEPPAMTKDTCRFSRDGPDVQYSHPLPGDTLRKYGHFLTMSMVSAAPLSAPGCREGWAGQTLGGPGHSWHWASTKRPPSTLVPPTLT